MWPYGSEVLVIHIAGGAGGDDEPAGLIIGDRCKRLIRSVKLDVRKSLPLRRALNAWRLRPCPQS
jgi:hypothetical protein